MSDWDYINEHMGGHDEDGLPNFRSTPGFGKETAEPVVFENFEEAKSWSLENGGLAFTRSPDGNGFIPKQTKRY